MSSESAATAEAKGHDRSPAGDPADETLLYHQFDDVAQQHEASVLGMWVFLATEVLFFGGLFAAYLVYRTLHPEAFIIGSQAQLVWLGGVNTAVLLCSSLTMALAVRAAQLRQRPRMVVLLIATMIFGAAFLGIKAFEYHRDWEEKLVPGLRFDRRPGAEGAVGHLAGKAVPLETVQGVEMYFVLYFFMTGLHAIHLIIGIVVVGIMAWLGGTRWLSGCGETHVDVTGLYWHFIDIVWVFLYPLLYLVDLHYKP